MSYAFNSPPKITPTELEPGHGLMPKKQGSAQPDLRDEIARLTAERDDWARKAMEWRRKYAELRYPGMTNEVHAHGVPVSQTDGDEDIIAPLPQRLAAALVEMAEGKPRGTGSILLQAAELLATYGVKVAHLKVSGPSPTDGSAKDNQALRTLSRLSDEMGEEL